MKKIVISFVLGAVLGWGGYWYVDHHKLWAWQTKQKVVGAVGDATDAVKGKFGEITTNVIREQLVKTGVFIAENARKAGAAVADAATDTKITTTIKARLLAEPGLASLGIHVSTTAGVVTLAGEVRYLDEVSRAVRIAMETDSVQKVISTLQVKGDKPAPPPPAK